MQIQLRLGGGFTAKTAAPFNEVKAEGVLSVWNLFIVHQSLRSLLIAAVASLSYFLIFIQKLFL